MKALCVFGLSLLVAAAPRAAGAGENEPKHLHDARKLVKHLDLKDTSYEHGKPDVQFAEPYRCHTDCSGFLDALLQYSYGYKPEQFKKWFGQKRPTADHFHDAIVKQEIFQQIKDFRQVQAGDILAVKYKHRKNKNTGHVMLASGAPRSMKAKEPVKPGTEQWEVPVIDSSHSGHGKTDTRHGKGKDGKDHDGLGEGILRVYTEKAGEIAGYTWSVGGKAFVNQQEDHMVVGRLKQ